MDKVCENSHQKPSLKEINNKQKYKLHQLDYEMFSHVIQNARRTVELNRIRSKRRSKVRDEKPPVKPNEDTNNNTGTSGENTNENVTLKSRRSLLLSDVKFAIGFLEYGNRSISDTFHMCCNTFIEINLFKNSFKHIEGVVKSIEDNAHNSEFLAELDGKVRDGETEMSLKYILRTGKTLLLQIEEALKNLNYLMETYSANLKIISSVVSMVCSYALETELDNNRDVMYAMINQADNNITMAHKELRKHIRNYNKQQSHFLEMHRRCSAFISESLAAFRCNFLIVYCY